MSAAAAAELGAQRADLARLSARIDELTLRRDALQRTDETGAQRVRLAEEIERAMSERRLVWNTIATLEFYQSRGASSSSSSPQPQDSVTASLDAIARFIDSLRTTQQTVAETVATVIAFIKENCGGVELSNVAEYTEYVRARTAIGAEIDKCLSVTKDTRAAENVKLFRRCTETLPPLRDTFRDAAANLMGRLRVLCREEVTRRGAPPVPESRAIEVASENRFVGLLVRGSGALVRLAAVAATETIFYTVETVLDSVTPSGRGGQAPLQIDYTPNNTFNFITNTTTNNQILNYAIMGRDGQLGDDDAAAYAGGLVAGAASSQMIEAARDSDALRELTDTVERLAITDGSSTDEAVGAATTEAVRRSARATKGVAPNRYGM